MSRYPINMPAAARRSQPFIIVLQLFGIAKGLHAARVDDDHRGLTESDVETRRSTVGEQLSLFDGVGNHGKH